MPKDELIEELKAQLEDHDKVMIMGPPRDTDSLFQEMAIENVHYDGEADCVVIQVDYA